ncbi:MAG: TRAP transporter substrate-binding protein DctP [Deltaproteobacteria bacterium]|nr:TRAP transporter substrate-binding protein DctP [Deltaproteobacteria bacterium]
MKKRSLMKHFVIVCVGVFSFLTVFFIAHPQHKAQAETKTIELKYVTMRGPTEPNAMIWQIPMSNEIEKRTGGKVKVVPYWSNSLGKTSEHFNLVKTGIADMTDYAGSYAPGKFVFAEVGNLPFAAKNPVNIRKAMSKMEDKGYFEESWGQVEVLGWNITPFYQLLFRKDKPITFYELSGKKIRTPGGYMTEFLKSIKAVPISIPPTDAYQAWERGLVEGWMHPMGAFNVYKLFEFSNRSLLTVDAMAMANAAVVINKKKLASLGPETQDIIRKVVSDYEDVYVKAGDYNDGEALKLINKTGVEIYTLPDPEMDKLRKAAMPVWDKFIADVDKNGGDGKAIVNEYIGLLKSLGEKPLYTP